MGILKPAVSRKKSIITNKDNLEHLYTIKNSPVFVGCTDAPPKEDILSDMVWDICRDSGCIQLRELLPLEIIYQNQHNEGLGKIWEDHYSAFADFLNKYRLKKILEIGGAHDKIALNYFALNKDAKWTIVEPNPQYIKEGRIKVIKSWFDENFKIEDEVEAVVHSHVLEHMYDPVKFIKNISTFLKIGSYHIFTFPNMLPMLQNKWTNCLNFEHTVFLTEEIVDYLLKKEDFEIIDKQYYGNPHSIFYATKKIAGSSEIPEFKNKYNEYKKIFLDYIDYHKNLVKQLNNLIEKSTHPVYLFGAHIFSQTLLSFGLKNDKIVSILDNSPLKQGQRLYGTRFQVEAPAVLKGQGSVNVILKAGIYNDEITKQLLSINPKITIW